jgi:TonB family protein
VAGGAGFARHTNEEALAAARVNARAPVVYLLSGDDGLLLELGPLMGARYRTRPIDSAEQIAPPGTAPWALIIDATARSDARAQAARLKQQYPSAPLLVICQDGSEADWAGPHSRGTVCAVIERSALATPAFGLALAAIDQQLQAATDDTAAAGATARRLPGAWRLPVAIVVALLIAGGGVWLWLQPGKQGATRTSQATASTPVNGTASPAPAQAPASPMPERTVLELLSDARVAFSEEKRQLPPVDGAQAGDNALGLYARVLARDAGNEEARDGMRRLFAIASARIKTDLATGRFDDASRLLTAFQGTGIAGRELATLQSELAAARPRWLAAQARAAIANGDTEAADRLTAQLAATGADHATLNDLQQSLQARQAEARLVALARRVHVAVTAGALQGPAPDSAEALVQEMQQIDPAHALTGGAQQELQNALAERAHAQQAAVAARAAAAAAPVATPQPAATPAAQAPAAAPAQEQYVAARSLTPLAVSYPQRALEAGQQGYVIVEFMLAADGRAGNPRVVESSPPQIFDAAALQAVRRGRFDTNALGNPARPRLARLRISFR